MSSCGRCEYNILMSRRPSLWSYISFGSPKETSYSLPTQNQHGLGYPDKVASPKRGIFNGGRADAYAMNGSQRSRFFKGGLVFSVILLLYFFASRDSTSILHSSSVGRDQVMYYYVLLTDSCRPVLLGQCWRRCQQSSANIEMHETFLQRQTLNPICVDG